MLSASIIFKFDNFGQGVVAINATMKSRKECDVLIASLRTLMPLLSMKREAVAADFGIVEDIPEPAFEEGCVKFLAYG